MTFSCEIFSHWEKASLYLSRVGWFQGWLPSFAGLVPVLPALGTLVDLTPESASVQALCFPG